MGGPRQRIQIASRWLDAWWTPRRVLWAGWLLFVVYCYPGYMSTDSVDQLLQARGVNELHDWYPPLMVVLWKACDSVVAGPFPMLVIQSVAFLLGLDAILGRAMRPRRAAILAALVLLFPPVMTPMAVIWKDSQMAGFLLAGTACLLSSRMRWRVVGCVLLFLATAQRYNAPAATLPIVLLLFTWRGELPRLKRYALAFGVWIAITIAAFGANRALTERKTYAWHGSLAMFDLVGMVRYAPPMSDDEVRERLAGVHIVPKHHLQDAMRAAYSPRAWFYLVNDDARVLDAPQTEADRAAVAAAWREMVTSYPTAYLHHRWRAFLKVLSVFDDHSGAEWDGFTEDSAQESMIGHSATHSTIQEAWLSLIPAIDDTLIFRAWAYFVLGFVLLPMCRKHRLAFVLIASGLLNELSLFLAAPSADYRYSHWMMASVIAGTIVVFARRYAALSTTGS